MAQIPYRANLQTMSFPLLSELSGRTIINPQADNTYARFVSSDGQSPIDIGIPQIFYCHNVMPSTYGWQSVRYNLQFAGPPVAGLDFENANLIYAGQVIAGPGGSTLLQSTGYKSYFAIAGVGLNKCYIMGGAGGWDLIPGGPSIPAGCVVTVATINGVSYIYFSGIGCYIFNNNTNTLIPRTLAGLDLGATLGIVAANGYLNAWNRVGVAWSSTVNVEDFVPSDITGAGGGQVQEAKGDIVTAVATSLGYILFTKENAVSAIYSGNADFPWNFKAIPASGGVASADVVSREQAAGFQQVYSTNGIQQITHARCNTVAPNITDFIAGNKFEDFDVTTNTFNVTTFEWSMRKKLAVVADRYIVISYGLSPTEDMTHALVMDLAQNRMGKLRITHTSCFELRSLNPGVTEIPRGSIAFLQKNGNVQVLDFGLMDPVPDSIMVLGKFQYVRQKLIELNSVEIECVSNARLFEAHSLASLHGKNFNTSKLGYLRTVEDNYREYVWDGQLGVNVSVLVKGTFNINSFVAWFSLVGNP